MTYYQNFIQNLASSPFDRYGEMTNAFICSQWHDSNLLSTVNQETEIGSFIFEPIEVWKNSVSHFQNAIVKNDRDFKRLMFKHRNTIVHRGRYYKFEEDGQNNYWLVYEGTSEEEQYTDVLVRRCNNMLKWIDKENGKLYEYPCVLEYDLVAPTPRVDKDIIVAYSGVTLVIQGNEITHKLKKNQRFIFNGQPFKFVAYNNWMQNGYITKDTTLLFIDLDLDIEKPTDDIENNIADYFEYYPNGMPQEDSEISGSNIIISPDFNSVNQYQSISFEANLYIDGEKQNDLIEVECHDAPINCYELERENNSFVLTNKKMSSIPLRLIFKHGDISKTSYISLKAMF